MKKGEVKTENKHLALSVKALEAVYIVRMDKMYMIFFKMIVCICEFHSGFSGKDVAYLDVFCMHMPRIISEFYYICTYGYVICIIYVLFHVIHHTLVINGIKKYQKLSFLLFLRNFVVINLMLRLEFCVLGLLRLILIM